MRVMIFLLLTALLAANPAFALTIATEDSPPSTIVKGDALSGVSVEIIREIQKRIGDTTHIDVFPWARAYSMATTTPDFILFATTRTPERESLFRWIGPIFSIKWGFFAMRNKAKPLLSLEEAKADVIIGTYKDDAREQFLKSQGFTNLDSSSSQMLNIRKLKAGRIDLLVSTNIGVATTPESAGLKPGDMVNVFTFKEVELYIAFSKGSDEATVAAWQKAFDEMRGDDTLEAIQKRWLPQEASTGK
ncbi:MAG: hypothetical protein FD177_2295 [Desulfovibrionaceae bacterium]|nr:MAG: hypothetical protein FD177_2295 [Desulfovibrionaceae bacterium]